MTTSRPWNLPLLAIRNASVQSFETPTCTIADRLTGESIRAWGHRRGGWGAKSLDRLWLLVRDGGTGGDEEPDGHRGSGQQHGGQDHGLEHVHAVGALTLVAEALTPRRQGG